MKGYFLDPNQCHYSYKFNEAKDLVSLFASRLGAWTGEWKGKRVAKLQHANDEYTITLKSGKSITVDVCELAEIVMLASAYDRAKNFRVLTEYKHAKEAK